MPLKKILIVEDELLIAKVLRICLEKDGYFVDNVADGNIAFEKVKEMLPDIIVMDVHLKNNTTGLATGKKIRDAGINTPIIFTTGNSFESTLKEIEQFAGTELLIKPIDYKHLTTVFKKFL